MNELLKQIRNTVRQHELIEAGDSVVVGFSGGPDSLCLLHGLYALKEELGIRTLAAVHVNHLYRGTAAYEDEAFCREFCRERDIRFRAVRADVEALAGEWGMGSEEAGRKVRYEEFAKAATETCGPVKIAVAHNREDQAETLFMRLVRGTGTAGLCGMDYRREDGVIRPLLDCSRRDIEAFLEAEGLQPRIDHTNLEPVYNRNLVRLDVIPYINERMGGDLIASLANLSRIAREDRDFIEGSVEKILGEARCEENPSSAPSGNLTPGGKVSVVVPWSSLAKAHPAVMKRAVVRCFERAGLLRDITSNHLDRAARLLQFGGTTWEAQFPHGYVMKRRYEKVIFEKEEPAEESGRHRMPGFSMCIEDPSPSPSGTLPPGEVAAEQPEMGERKAAFDLDRIRDAGGEESLALRTRRAGDVISPKGFSGTKKLQNYFVDRKIDRDLRDRLPLLCLGTQILWIPGYEISEKFRVKEDTERVLYVRIED